MSGVALTGSGSVRRGDPPLPLFSEGQSPVGVTSLRLRAGLRIRPALDRIIAAASLVPDAPVLDVRTFAWTRHLREDWRAIRDEAGAPECPATRAALARIPGLHHAGFARLPAGGYLPAGRGLTKGLLTCHLGLSVPDEGDARMRIGDRTVRWAEGQTLLFDDSYEHEAWNDGTSDRLVLSVQFRRPQRQPGSWLTDLVLAGMRRAQRAAPVVARTISV